ncbi:MAG: nuclear transport factor 2 family protein [Solirubrobacteraceae bacterium]
MIATTPLDADQAFFAALRSADLWALDALLTGDFTLIDGLSGSLVAREALIRAVADGWIAYAALQAVGEPLVHDYGSAAVVIGLATATDPLDGGGCDVDSRYAHVFVEVAGRWRIASAQGTPLALAR